jgi:hypothetical protein
MIDDLLQNLYDPFSFPFTAPAGRLSPACRTASTSKFEQYGSPCMPACYSSSSTACTAAPDEEHRTGQRNVPHCCAFSHSKLRGRARSCPRPGDSYYGRTRSPCTNVSNHMHAQPLAGYGRRPAARLPRIAAVVSSGSAPLYVRTWKAATATPRAPPPHRSLQHQRLPRAGRHGAGAQLPAGPPAHGLRGSPGLSPCGLYVEVARRSLRRSFFDMGGNARILTARRVRRVAAGGDRILSTPHVRLFGRSAGSCLPFYGTVRLHARRVQRFMPARVLITRCVSGVNDWGFLCC